MMMSINVWGEIEYPALQNSRTMLTTLKRLDLETEHAFHTDIISKALYLMMTTDSVWGATQRPKSSVRYYGTGKTW